MNWRNTLIISSTLALVLSASTLLFACLEYWEAEYSRILFFIPENGNTSSSHWWYKQTHTFGNEIELDNTSQDPDVLQLCNEWNALLGGGYETADIKEVVFGETTVRKGKLILDSNAAPSAQKVLQAFIKKPALYQYLIEAKQLENVFIGNYRDWYSITEEEIRESEKQYKAKATELIALANSVKNNKPLYEKYLFQIIKLSASGFEHQRLIKYYDEFRATNVSSTLQGWGMLYYLTVYTTDTINENRMLAEVLRLSPGKSKRCAQLFTPTKDTRYIDTIKDPVLKANLLSMQALFDYRPAATYLSAIAKLDPENVFLTDLIGREINKYEDYKFSNALTGHNVLGQLSSAAWHEKDFKELLSVLTYLYQVKEISDKYHDYFSLALAHAKALNGETKESAALLSEINTQHLPYRIQKCITNLYLLTGQNLSDEVIMDQIAEQIITVSSLAKNNENTNRCISGILLKMHKALMNKNEVAISGLCLLNSNMIRFTNNYFMDYTWYELNATHEQFRDLERILKNKNKRPYEKLLTRGLDLPLVYNSRAKMFIREQNLDSALVYLNKLPDYFLVQHYNFLIETNSFFKEEGVANKTMTVLEALTLLHQKIKTAPALSDNNKKASEYLAIANAFFELSNRGNYCFVTGYYSSNYIPQSIKDIRSKHPEAFYHFYLLAEPAFSYFQKARILSKDKELSAAIQYYYMRAYDKIEGSKEGKVSNEGWIRYFKDYGHTSFYNTHSCPGIEWYLEKAS